MSMKENLIREYLIKVDFNRDDWSLSRIKQDMRTFLGEEPGIDIIYKKDVILNEVKGEAEEIKSMFLKMEQGEYAAPYSPLTP